MQQPSRQTQLDGTRRTGSPPAWLSEAADLGKDPEELNARHTARINAEHRANRWAHLANIGLGTWLVTQPHDRASGCRVDCVHHHPADSHRHLEHHRPDRAAAILVQIPYPLDEMIATFQFMRRWVKRGRNALRVFLLGDTDDVDATKAPNPTSDEFDRPPGAVIRAMVGGGVGLPWNLALSGLVGLSLLFTRVTLGAEGSMVNSDHLIGSLVLTVVSLAAAEVARPLRFLNIPLGLALFATPLIHGAGMTATVADIACGVALVALSVRRGPIREHYGSWSRMVV